MEKNGQVCVCIHRLLVCFPLFPGFLFLFPLYPMFHATFVKMAEIKIHLSLLLHFPLPTCDRNEGENEYRIFEYCSRNLAADSVFFLWLYLGLPSLQPHLGVRTFWLHLRPLNTWLYFSLLTHRIHLSSIVPHFHHGPSSHWLRRVPLSIWLVPCPFQASGYASAIHPFGLTGLHLPCSFSLPPPWFSKPPSPPQSHEPLAPPWPSRPAVTPCDFGSALVSSAHGSTSVGSPLVPPRLVAEASPWLLPPLVSSWAWY